MTLNAIDSIFNETRMLRKAQQLVGERPGEKFNIFNILGMESDEVYTHSRFLTEMLSPQGSHGLGTTFLKLWLDQIEAIDFDSEHASCSAEYYIGPVTPTEGGRIDILIKNGTSKVIIENKIFAGDQTNQLLRYYNYDQKAKLYYLTLFGTQPSEESTGKGQLLPDQYICISYAVHVVEWLKKCRKESADMPIIRETITQYISLIKKLTNQNFDGKMQQELVKKILSSADNLTSFFELQSPVVIQTVYEELIKKMETDLQEMVEQMQLKISFHLQTRKRWQGFTISGNKELDEMKIFMDFQFDQFPNRMKFGFSFPPNKENTPEVPEFSLAPLIDRFKTIYPEAKSHYWWPCYIYWNDSGIEISNDIYFSTNFINNIREKIVQMLEITHIAYKEISNKI